ncbi:hypothetical protein MMC26_005616 [Xylographa opegraphella]|nr:hypothetical protein [Xylographa opegraphella]
MALGTASDEAAEGSNITTVLTPNCCTMERNTLVRLGFAARICICFKQPRALRPFTIASQGTSAPASYQNAPFNRPTNNSQSGLGRLSMDFGLKQDSSITSSLPQYLSPPAAPVAPPHHLHVFSSKHNTHITLTRPDRNPIIAVSTGNLGFKKAARGTYDAAYQLGAYMMNRIQQEGLLAKIQKLELVLRGYGDGREAIKKILLGSEGMGLRPRIVRVTDATRLKFGGTRSKKPRRLG